MIYFRELIKGQVFRYKGSLYIKKSSRLAVDITNNKNIYINKQERVGK